MKIAIIGYGKMGKGIEKMAKEQGHDVFIIDTKSTLSLSDQLTTILPDVAIEFTVPDAAYSNLKTCIECGIPVISGTTGWTEKLPKIEALTKEKQGSFLYGSNFSIGVNLFFDLNKKLSSLMQTHISYEASIEEIHHTEKKDAPSGTAITLAEGLIEEHKSYDRWTLVEGNNLKAPNLAITALREEGVPGTHEISYKNEIDEISIKHTAFSRAGFISGALLAAKYIHDKKGVFTMKEVLGL